MDVVLQVALDFLNLSQALRVAREALAGGADWLEAGTPLIKSEGLEAVRQLRREFPQTPIVADLKTIDAGRIEIEAAAKAGASVAMVLGLASDATLQECIKAGQNFGVQVAVDLLGCPDPVARARQVADWGAASVALHIPIDEQMAGSHLHLAHGGHVRNEDVTPGAFDELRRVAQDVPIPVAVAGGINSESVVQAIAAGARIVVVGGAIAKSANATEATAAIKGAMATGRAVHTELYHRGGAEAVRQILEKVSTANLSDGNHRLPAIVGLRPVWPGARMVGQALTVRTAPGDWAKPVEAIDKAEPGAVIVVDAGGRPPAVWGELATESCVKRGIAGVAVDGAVRDTPSIVELRFSCFARSISAAAGEPKGYGEIGVTIRIEGIEVNTGDWVLADDDGVMVVPRPQAAEMANRAMDCLERENRIRGEIRSQHTTLAQVLELLRWEKK
ncbi:MAG: bifunctional hexulose-6-phosphate synthase/ribonuclease regulator [Planctomycetes bacterium]|nr:bifunctional hexulose-6-phosphate synthase/ribonuclease regulator [Planctomycetota bacterium]